MLLAALRDGLGPEDAVLVGVEPRSEGAVTVSAYQDARTAQLNLAVLVRLNRELGARFDPSRFHHVVEWNDLSSSVELYLESREDQVIWIASLDVAVAFRAGERIHTASSARLDDQAMALVLETAGFSRVCTITDRAVRFAVHLARRDHREKRVSRV